VIEQAYHYLFIVLFVILGFCILACLIRAIKGPKLTDRVVAGNMIGTVVMMIITMLSGYLKEGYLIDVCTVYAMISFVGVVVLTKVYTRAHQENVESGAEKNFTGEAE
jgi:multicomponent Na+:H+ antiporter subunit F